MGADYSSTYDFSEVTYTGSNGRFFKWSIHGLDSNFQTCDSSTIPDDFSPSNGRWGPTNHGWNVHGAIPEITKEEVIDDILDWVTPPAPSAPAASLSFTAYMPSPKATPLAMTPPSTANSRAMAPIVRAAGKNSMQVFERSSKKSSVRVSAPRVKF